MSEIEKLAQCFIKFPGIGTRQAKRFVYFLLASNPQFLDEISARIGALRQKISQCSDCLRYFENSSEGSMARCVFCRETVADAGKLLVVEKDIDLENVRKSGAYHGRYFVLGSLIPLAEIKKAEIMPRLPELLRRIQSDGGRVACEEVILALSATPEGDHTALELALAMKPLQEKHGFKISRLGRGLSTGSELEYADSETLKNALENRVS